MKTFRLTMFFCVLVLQTSSTVAQDQQQTKQPNILWLFQEDLSPWLGCYGYDLQKGHTPTIDAMAADGVRFSRAFAPAPVCSACRSAIITGAYQIRFGAHEHRSRRGKGKLPLPEGMKTIADLMTEKGYFCFNVGKTDYNFEHANVFEQVPKRQRTTPWRARKGGQSFFGQIQLKGGKLNTENFSDKINRSKVTIPADYPQTDLYREIVAEHFDSARKDDRNIAGILKRLKADGLAESTIIVYFSDHGANNLVRHKQQPTEGGSHVPFVITGPAKWVPKSVVRNDLVSMLDLSATTLQWAGVEQPEWMEGQYLFGGDFVPREFVATARDRCDHSIDRIRSIRTDQFRFTRNYMLDRVLLQPQYRDKKPFLKVLREGYADGTLAPKLAEIYFGERPYEELYDVKVDPAQLNNLIDDPKYAAEVKRHRKLLNDWLAKGDVGAGEEPAIELKMASNKGWGQGVNAEFESIRQDSDGDGLSDTWEQLNGRNPQDGKLMFTFDCGGWQTEGWESVGNLTNISGRQGFLDFDLIEGSGGIKRTGLNVKADTNKQVQVRFRSSGQVKLSLTVNGAQSGEINVKPGAVFRTHDLIKQPISGDQINTLQVNFVAQPKTTVEIDWIK